MQDENKEKKLLDGTLSRSKKKYDFDQLTGRYTRRPDANPRSPDYYGTFKLAIPGVPDPYKVYVSAWVRKGQDGTAFLSVSGEPDRDEHRLLSIGGITPPRSVYTSVYTPPQSNGNAANRASSEPPPQEDEEPLPF